MTANEEVSEDNPSDVGFFMLKLQDLKAGQKCVIFACYIMLQ